MAARARSAIHTVLASAIDPIHRDPAASNPVHRWQISGVIDSGSAVCVGG